MHTPTPQLNDSIQAHRILGLLFAQGRLRLAETLTLHQQHTGDALDLASNPNPAVHRLHCRELVLLGTIVSRSWFCAPTNG